MKKQAASLLVMFQLMVLISPALAAEPVYGNPYTRTIEGYSWWGYWPELSKSAGTTPAVLPEKSGDTNLLAQANATLSSPQAILDRLKTANKVPQNISPALEVERSDVLNASTNGQNLIITDSLLNKLKTDDERAFVISHELAHILLSHIGKTQIRRTGLSLLDQFLGRKFGQNSLLTLASELGINLIDLKSSRGYEYQADDLGIKLMVNAGYDPQAALRVFEVLETASAGSGTPGFLRSHPLTKDRIRALVQKYKLSIN